MSADLNTSVPLTEFTFLKNLAGFPANIVLSGTIVPALTKELAPN